MHLALCISQMFSVLDNQLQSHLNMFVISFGLRGNSLMTLYGEILHMAVVTDDGEALSEAFSCRGEENDLEQGHVV